MRKIVPSFAVRGLMIPKEPQEMLYQQQDDSKTIFSAGIVPILWFCVCIIFNQKGFSKIGSPFSLDICDKLVVAMYQYDFSKVKYFSKPTSI